MDPSDEINDRLDGKRLALTKGKVCFWQRREGRVVHEALHFGLYWIRRQEAMNRPDSVD